MADMKVALASRQGESTKRKNLVAKVGWWKNIKDV
jgi:hypothetical protein